MEEVRRDGDGELCGYVAARDGGWRALTVFGAELAVCAGRDEAVLIVRDRGLAVLADRWVLGRDGRDEQVVRIVEARPGSATVALGYDAMPGVPTVTITSAELDAGACTLRPA